MADIAQLRLREKTLINEEIRMNQKYNELDSASLARFRSVTADKYALTQTEKLTNNVKERTSLISDLETRLSLLETGELDSELLKTVKANTQLANQKHLEHVNAKKAEKKLKEEDAAMSKAYYNKERQGDRLDKSYYYNSSLRHFNKAEDTLPEWMRTDLEKMPNNEGIIWKNVYFFGLNPPNNNPYTQVTEYKKGLKIIQRWDSTWLSVYEKKGREREVMVSQTPRKKIH